ncbi:hypothetical protein SESBI_46946 [Sesbania bispinosa]|nr:hypothetical protein SESBI_46946 [Sesbania bispinosa]
MFHSRRGHQRPIQYAPCHPLQTRSSETHPICSMSSTLDEIFIDPSDMLHVIHCRRDALRLIRDTHQC